MLALTPKHEARFQDDIYVIRVRGNHPQVLLNSGYHGLRIVDLPSCEVIKEIPFPEAKEGYAPETCFISPDGRWSYLFSAEERYGLEVDLQQDTIRRISTSPRMDPLSGLCWFMPELHVWDYHKYEWFLSGERLLPLADMPASGLERGQGFRNMLSRVEGFSVIKTSHAPQGFYVISNEADRIGYIPLEGKPLLAPQDGSAVDTAHYKDDLFVCFANKVVQFSNGAWRVELESLDEEYFLAVNVLEIKSNAYLSVLTSTKDHRTAILKVFELTTGPIGPILP